MRGEPTNGLLKPLPLYREIGWKWPGPSGSNSCSLKLDWYNMNSKHTCQSEGDFRKGYCIPGCVWGWGHYFGAMVAVTATAALQINLAEHCQSLDFIINISICLIKFGIALIKHLVV